MSTSQRDYSLDYCSKHGFAQFPCYLCDVSGFKEYVPAAMKIRDGMTYEEALRAAQEQIDAQAAVIKTLEERVAKLELEARPQRPPKLTAAEATERAVEALRKQGQDHRSDDACCDVEYTGVHHASCPHHPTARRNGARR